MEVFPQDSVRLSNIARELVEGEGTFFGASGERVVRGGEIAIVPADEPHGFTNTGDGPLKQIDIHVSPKFKTEWLKGRAAGG